jgi:Domain of unknown function (DUF4386)
MANGSVSAKEHSMRMLGGALSILTGVVFFATALAFFLLPPDQLNFTATAEFFQSVAAHPTGLTLTFWGSMIGALLAIGAVMAIADHVRRANEGLVRWTSMLAIIAYAVAAVGNATDLIRIPDLAARYVQGDLPTRAAIEAGGLTSLDPSLLMHSILLGIWFLSVNFLALRSRTLPRPLAWIGLIYGIGALLTVLLFLLNMQLPLLVARGVGLVVLSPVWFVGTGIILLRK